MNDLFGHVPLPATSELEARAHIDEEIRKLCYRRNSLSPFCRLPLEILTTIFIHCARYHYDHTFTYVRPLQAPTWVNVSYVCQHWRAVALDCPTLWSYHFVASSRWTDELLARSRQASLKIRVMFRDTDPWWWDLIKKLMKHSERIQELTLHLPGPSANEVLSILSSRAPRMQNLQIVVNSKRGVAPMSTFFQEYTPALRSLELVQCPVPWHSLKLNDLTLLSLHCIPYRKNMEDFLAILRCMPKLKELHVDRVLPGCRDFVSSATFNAFQKINFPHLSTLWISAPLSTVIAFLSCIIAPLDTEILLMCSSEFGFSSQNYTLLGPLLACRFNAAEAQSPYRQTIRSLVIRLCGSGAIFMFKASERDCSASDVGLRSGIPLRIVADLGTSLVGDMNSLVGDICRSIPLTNVQTLHVVNPTFWSGVWDQMLSCLRNLQYIMLSQGYMPDLASVLSSHKTVRNEGGNARMLVPALEEMKLDRIIFSVAEGSNLPGPAITQQNLFDALSARGMPGGRLSMVRCMNAGSAILPDMVRSWDGLVNVPDTDGSDAESYPRLRNWGDEFFDELWEDSSEDDQEDDWESDTEGSE